MAINRGMTALNSGLGSIGGNVRPRVGDGIPPMVQLLASATVNYFVGRPSDTDPIEPHRIPPDPGIVAVKGIIAYRKSVKPLVNIAPVEPATVGASTTGDLITQPETPKNYWRGLAIEMRELYERLQSGIEPAK